jgi:orotate phosphoribosyltransferase
METAGYGALFSAKLLQIEAIQLRPETPFTWASGWKSPIYCDNRLTLSYPAIRTLVSQGLSDMCKRHFPNAGCVAGVATAGIPHGLLLAEALDLPFVYVRADAKKHGKQNKIEGRIPEGAEVVVVEDLISTGGSSLRAVDALRYANANVKGLLALFTYGFDLAVKAFNDASVPFYTITDYNQTIETAIAEGKIREDQRGLLNQWRQDPENWRQ